MRKLIDRTAVVTGAGSGIGRATAELLARRGCRVALVDVSEASLAEVADRIRRVGGVVSVHTVDVSQREQMMSLPEEVVREHGAVHILVNNAGVTVAKTFHEHTLEDLEWVTGVNLWGTIYGCKAFLDHLLVADEAHIVNISSIFGIVGIPSQSGYCASKFAVRGLTETLWEELRGTHIGVSCVHPGGVATNIVRAARVGDEKLRGRLDGFFQKTGVAPEYVAGRIVNAIEHNQRRVLITKEAYLFDGLRRLLPEWGNQLAVQAIMRSAGVAHKLGEMQRRSLTDARRKQS